MSTITSATELGKAIRGARVQSGLTQLQLAKRAGVSRKLIGDLEAGKDTAALGCALRVADAAGISWRRPAPTPQSVLDDAVEAVREERAKGDSEFALRLVLDVIKRLQSMKPTALKKPRTTGDPRWDTLIAAGARIALRGTGAKPRWGHPLANPWFPADDLHEMSEAYRNLTVRRTPKEFADFNIFLNSRSTADG